MHFICATIFSAIEKTFLKSFNLTISMFKPFWFIVPIFDPKFQNKTFWNTKLKIALVQCKQGKNFLPFIFRLYILRCMTQAGTAKEGAEKTPSPSTITLTPLDAFPEDSTKKHHLLLLHHAPQHQKWCNRFQLWLQRISIKCLGLLPVTLINTVELSFQLPLFASNLCIG